MTHRISTAVADERPELLVFCGIVGMFGVVAMTIGIVILQFIHPDHDAVRNTISDLGRGNMSIYMDALFYLNAAAMIALAIGAAHFHLGEWGWSLGLIMSVLVALDLTLLGVWDQFGRTAEGEGMSVHTSISTVLLPLYLIGPLSMAKGIGKAARWARWCLLASAVLWPILAVTYFFGPAAYAGLLERLAGIATLLWTVPLGWVLLTRGLSQRT